MFYKQTKHEKEYAMLFMEYKITQMSSPYLHTGTHILTKNMTLQIIQTQVILMHFLQLDTFVGIFNKISKAPQPKITSIYQQVRRQCGTDDNGNLVVPGALSPNIKSLINTHSQLELRFIFHNNDSCFLLKWHNLCCLMLQQ